jgi:hypothetical protein
MDFSPASNLKTADYNIQKESTHHLVLHLLAEHNSTPPRRLFTDKQLDAGVLFQTTTHHFVLLLQSR